MQLLEYFFFHYQDIPYIPHPNTYHENIHYVLLKIITYKIINTQNENCAC